MPTYAERSEQKATGKKRMVLYGGFLFSIFCCFVASVTLVLILRNQYLAHTQEGIVSSTLLLEVKWTYEAESVVSDPPWYTDDVVLVRSRLPNSEDLPNLKEADTWIDAVDLETGRRQWGFARHSIGVRRPNWQELDAGNQIAVLTYKEGQMAALDVREGTVRWRRGPGYFRALIIADGLLYMAAYGELRCYDVSTGVWLWDADLPDENVTRLAIDQGRLYALSRETWILDSLTGNLETTFNTPDPSVIVMIAEGKIFTATRDKVLAYDAGTTQLLWSVPYQFENPHWYPLIVGGTLYFRTSDGSLVATNVETGQVMWEYRPSDAQVISNVAVLNEWVYFLVSDKTLRAVDVTSGQEVGRLQSSQLSSWHDVEVGEGIIVPGVAASEDMLFVSFGGHAVYAFAPID